MYSEAATILMERFPHLGLLATSSEKKEIETQSPKIEIGKETAIYFYGLNPTTYFHCKDWLNNENHTLIFLEDEPGVIASFLHLPEAAEILSHSQVHIALAQEIDSCVEQFPVERVEVFGLSSKKSLKSLRLKILRKTTLAHALHLDRLYGYQLFHHFVQNVKHIPGSFYANALKNSFQNVPAVVCGAGPSLSSTFETLKGLENKAVIIAGGSTIAALSSNGITPHFGMAVDPNLEEYRRFRNSFAFEVPLLYSTRLFPAVFQTCNGPFGYMRSGIGGAPELWLEEELGLLDPLMVDVFSPESIAVTPICVAWAQFLGCNPILLNGVDLAYTGNRRYAKGVIEEKKLQFRAMDSEKMASDRILRRKSRNGKQVYTAVRWVMEASSISQFAAKHPEVEFVNTTEGGIGFKGISYMPIEKAASGFQTLPIRKMVHERIDQAKMPAGTEAKIQKKMSELKESLERVIGYLQILTGEIKGSSALAELELQEELATLVLFYDIAKIFKKDLWKNWLQLARKYQDSIS